ncbi:MAG: hypothetical protein K9N01_02850 [Cephaloticoccus sp.]|nr:hypothetical protein [Cephaloticoccus sp.]
MKAASSPPSERAGEKPQWHWLQWPMLRVWALVVALLLIGERFPFSYFPMYSSFDSSTDYYFVTNEKSEPYACVEIFGTSTANVKKMYRARLRELVAARGVGEEGATELERHRVGGIMLEYLRELGAQTGKPVPLEPVLLKRVILERSDTGEITRREIVVAEG